jgi:leucyl/phenylalanyl-tRNA---protein transferase
MAARWYADWDSFRLHPEAVDGPVAFGADLSPDSVLAAYRRGVIPFPAADEYHRTLHEVRYEDQVAAGVIGLVGDPAGGDPYAVAWWSPDPRLVLAPGHVHLGRNVRRQLRRGSAWTTADTAFERVAQQCRAGREPRWLTDPLLESLVALHEKGWAHSVEVWQDDELAGGAFGVSAGLVLSGDSIFSRYPDAGRIAVADLAARLAAAGGELVDAQWDSAFLRSLGARPMSRADYLDRLSRGPAERLALPGEPQPARRLLPGLFAAEPPHVVGQHVQSVQAEPFHHQLAQALAVDAEGPLGQGPPGLGEHGVGHPAVRGRGLAPDQARLLQPVGHLGETAAGEGHLLGQLAQRHGRAAAVAQQPDQGEERGRGQPGLLLDLLGEQVGDVGVAADHSLPGPGQLIRRAQFGCGLANGVVRDGLPRQAGHFLTIRGPVMHRKSLVRKLIPH